MNKNQIPFSKISQTTNSKSQKHHSKSQLKEHYRNFINQSINSSNKTKNDQKDNFISTPNHLSKDFDSISDSSPLSSPDFRLPTSVINHNSSKSDPLEFTQRIQFSGSNSSSPELHSDSSLSDIAKLEVDTMEPVTQTSPEDSSEVEEEESISSKDSGLFGFVKTFLSKKVYQRIQETNEIHLEIPTHNKRPFFWTYASDPEYADLIIDTVSEILETLDIINISYSDAINIILEKLKRTPLSIKKTFENLQQSLPDAMKASPIKAFSKIADQILINNMHHVLGLVV